MLTSSISASLSPVLPLDKNSKSTNSPTRYDYLTTPCHAHDAIDVLVSVCLTVMHNGALI